MADFRKTAGSLISGGLNDDNRILTVALGQTAEVTLYGGGPPPANLDLDVRPNDPSVVQLDELTARRQSAQNLRVFSIRGKRTGNVMVEARVPPGPEAAANDTWATWPVWAFMQVAIVPEFSSANAALRSAIEDGRIQFPHEGARRLFMIALNGETVQGRTVSHAPELERVLAALASKGGLQIMRTFAPRDGKGNLQGPHGVEEGLDRYVCRAADIMKYGSTTIHYTMTSGVQIAVVERLLRDLPADVTYDLGFPRPVGGKGHFNKELDVFFPVRTVAEADAAYEGRAPRPFENMLEPAKSRIRPALAGKRVGVMFPDAADHMHIKVY